MRISASGYGNFRQSFGSNPAVKAEVKRAGEELAPAVKAMIDYAQHECPAMFAVREKIPEPPAFVRRSGTIASDEILRPPKSSAKDEPARPFRIPWLLVGHVR